MNAAATEASGWAQVLEELERDVAELDAALADEAPLPIRTWVPPRELGALPDDLRPRAEELALQLVELQSRTRDRLGELSADLQDVEQRRRAGTAYAR